MIRMLILLAILTPAGLSGPTVPGKLLFEDQFDRGDMAPKWKVGKGLFEVKDGTVTVAENPDDKHGAYAYVQPKFIFKDIIVEYSARLDGSRACHLMVNDSTYKEAHAGHILRASLLPGKVDLADYKFGAMKNEVFDKMKDPATPDEEKKRLRESIKDKGAVFKTEADLAQWHKIRVEILGDEMFVSIDDTPAGYLKSAGLDHATKNAIGFEVGGKASQLKAMRIWEAVPAADAAARRDAFLAALKK
ncbi:MAG TPA: hypothetical protein VG457_09175 [Planctomycetota bacterium]|jgi:hypothetical protein|nr:hypothetical protein [Planctomycetota bacterium]